MMHDDIQSDSDYDNPYQETALQWHHRHLQRIARRRCGMDSSSDDDDSLDEDAKDASRDNSELANVIFSRWMASFPLIAARCSLFIEGQNSKRRSARDQEAKSLRRVLRKISNRKNNNQSANGIIEPQNTALSSEEMKYHQLVANSILPKGLGISFVDAVLSRGLMTNQPFVNGQKQQQQLTVCRTVLEISGPARSGTTSILISLAARYAANTSNLFLEISDANESTVTLQSHTTERFTSPNTVIDNPLGDSPNKTTKHNTTSAEPQVVILDLEHGIHTVKLVLSVREAVLRRWEETSLARKWRIRQQQKHNAKDAYKDTSHIENDAQVMDAIKEQRQIERIIASCLGRIHIIQSRDFTYLSLVATIESLNKRLDDGKLLYQSTDSKPIISDIQQPPTLLIIDSLSTLDACTRAQENLPTKSGSTGGSGLSERNEFYRQLVRLRDEHEVAIIGSSRKISTNDGDDGRAGSIWDKMVTHRVGLHHAAEGTVESRQGFDFVATVKANQADGGVFPYSVTNSGIHTG